VELAVGFLILLSIVFIIAMVIFMLFDVTPLVDLFYLLALAAILIGLTILIVSAVINIMTGEWPM